MKGFLCVGGPYAGKRLAPIRPGHPRLIVSTPRTLKDALIATSGTPQEAMFAEFDRVTYHLQQWTNEDGSFFEIWTPEGQSHDETMAALLTAYEERNR